MPVVSQADSPGHRPCLCTPVPKSPLGEPARRAAFRVGTVRTRQPGIVEWPTLLSSYLYKPQDYQGCVRGHPLQEETIVNMTAGQTAAGN